MTTSTADRSRFAARLDGDRIAVVGLLAAVVVPLLVFVLAPLFEIFKMSFVTPEGIGLGNYVRYVNSPKFAQGGGQQPGRRSDHDGDHRAARLCLCLRDAQDRDAAEECLRLDRAAATVRAVAGAGAGHRVPVRA